ncbi:MAG: TonB-dependent receptor [Pseudomonadota bacterium]
MDIPEQPLKDFIVSLGQQFDVTILAKPDLIENKRSMTVQGNYTVTEAIGIALSESGLVARRQPTGALLIQVAAANENRTLSSPINRTDEPAKIEEIIIAGTKRNLSIQDTQASVAVITDAVIDQQAIFELTDVFLRTANVTNSGGTAGFSIRGINSSGVGAGGTGRTSNVYVDSAPASLNGLSSAFNLWDIDQVEILRGPQSTTQGRNALAGAVVIQSADPEYEYAGKLRALAGADQTYQLSGVATGPIVGDQVAFRISADYREQDFDTLNGVQNIAEGASDATTVRGKLLFEPNSLPDLRVELSLAYVDFFTSGDGSGVIRPPVGTPESVNFNPFDRISFDGRAGVVDNENTRYLVDIMYAFTDHWSSQLVATYDDTERLITNVGGPDLRTEVTYTADFRANFDYERMRGWLGAYYFNEDLTSGTSQLFDVTTFGGSINPVGTVVQFEQSRAAETENYAIYADALIDLTDSISINIGARYDWEDAVDTGFASRVSVDADPCSLTLFGNTLPCALFLSSFGSADPVAAVTYEAFLPRVGIIYSLDDDKSLSLMIQRGYRAGGFFVLGDSVETFDAEFITNYELAWRSVFMNGRLLLNANVFFAEWTDQQVRIQEPGLLDFRILNAGESELYGLEVETRFEISSALNVFANLGLVETEFTDFPFGVDTQGNPLPGIEGNPYANLSGNAFDSAPNLTATLGVNYDNDTGFFGSALVSFRDEQFTDITNLEVNETDSYAIVNARLGYKTRVWSLSVFADNLFENEFLRTNLLEEVVRSTNSVSVGLANIGRNNISQPRHIGIEFEIAF